MAHLTAVALRAAPLGSLLLLAACGGTPAEKPAQTLDVPPIGNYFVGSKPVYAQLVNASGGSWVFTTVSASDAPTDSAFLVRLNDLTPVFDIRVAECTPQAYPATHRCSLTHPFREKDAGVLDKIINSGIAVGTAGKVTEISQTYETRFDEAEFNRAVDEALVNTGLDRSRTELIDALGRYDALLASGEATIEQLSRQVTASQSNTADVVLRVKPEVGGLVDYYSGDIDFTEIVRLSAAGREAAASAGFEKDPGILPCDARYCLAAAEKAVAQLSARIESEKAQLAQRIAPDSRSFALNCDATDYRGYHLEVRCPEVVDVIAGQPADVAVGVTILSRDFDSLYPAFSLADERLRVDISGNKVRFSNATPSYLTLTAQTVYYNSRVQTTNAPIDLPPGVTIERDIAEFASAPIAIESNYRYMTPDKAANASFRFGYAVRYRLTSSTKEVTLHDVARFNVGCVIDARLRNSANDCREPELDTVPAGDVDAG